MTETLKFQPPPKRKKRRSSPGFGLLTQTTVARMLDLHPNVISRAIALGEVRTVSFSGHCYIPRSEVERLQKLFSGEVSE